MKSTLYRKKWPLLVFLVPALAFLLVFLYYPFVQNIINSMSEISGLGTPSQGMQEPWYANYAALFTDSRLRTAMKNTLILMVCTVVFQVGIALVLALLVDPSGWAPSCSGRCTSSPSSFPPRPWA